MSVSKNNELLRANQSYSTNGFSISCLLPWVHSIDRGIFILCKYCFCVHGSYFILSISLARSARYICLASNSICFRFAQTRYDINPRSRSEHIECVSTYRTRKRISKICESGFISMRSVPKDTTLTTQPFVLNFIFLNKLLL